MLTNKKPIGFLENAVLTKWLWNSNIEVLEGNCISHEYRQDLIHQWIHTSEIINKIDDNTFETRNSIYKVVSWKND